MAKKRASFYEILVYIAYGFFISMGIVWFLMSMPRFSYQAFLVMVIFGVQAYYRNKATNLILGLLSLMLSIFMLLEVIQKNDLFAKNAAPDNVAKGLLWYCLASIVMSVVLVFSYTKLSFKEQE
jgi:hypothetical protein